MIFRTLAFDAPVRGVPVGVYCCAVWYGKNRMVGLRNGEKSSRIYVTVLTEYRHVTNGQTDRWTSCDGIVRAMHSIAR